MSIYPKRDAMKTRPNAGLDLALCALAVLHPYNRANAQAVRRAL